VTKAHKVTACQGVFKRSLSVMETYAINGVLNIGVETDYFTFLVNTAFYSFDYLHENFGDF
jgi:hypothetical protein